MQKNLHKDGFDILKKISHVLNQAGVKYFVDCGTLLGFVRDGDFIAHDTDIDMGIYLNEKFSKEDLDKVMLSIGLKKHHVFYYQSIPVEISYSKGSIIVDFFQHFETEGHSIQYCFARNPSKDYPKDNFFDVYRVEHSHIIGLKLITIKNVQVYVPQNCDEYLASSYTENWRIPNPHWSSNDAVNNHLLNGEYGILEK